MSERFEQLYKLEENLYCDGAPIVISFGQLLKDTTTDNIVAQLKLHSISNKIIIAAKVSVCAFDVFSKEVQGVADYQYLDLKITTGQYFGADKAILMPDIKTRRFDINGISIVFSDHTIWEWNNETKLKSIPKPNRIENQLNNAELLNQYRIMTTEQAVCTPEVYENLWICTCGEINNDSICTNCKCSKNKVFEYFNVENLSLYLEERLLKEQQERKERENLAKMQREAEEKAKQESIAKNKKCIKFILIITAVVVVISIVLSHLISHIKYNNAITEIEHHISDSHFEYAFDLVIDAKIKEPKRKEYLDVVVPKMKENFSQSKAENVVLVCDDFSIIKDGRTLYIQRGQDKEKIYELPTDTVKYGDKFGSYGWESGSRYELEETYMYAGGYVLFAKHSSTILPHDSKWKYHFEMDTTIIAYDINRKVCKTILIAANDPGMAHFVKLIDGRVILNVSGAIFNPYTGDVQEESNLISKKDEDDYIYPYEYVYGLDYIYKVEQ